MDQTESDTGDVSSAQAVLLGALAPGVNVRTITRLFMNSYNRFAYSYIIRVLVRFFSFKFVSFSFSGSYLDYIKVEFSTAWSVSCCYAGFSILLQRFGIDVSCCLPCSNMRFPLFTP